MKFQFQYFPGIAVRHCGWAVAAGFCLSACGEEPAPAPVAAPTGPTALRTLQEPIPQVCTDKITVCWASEVGKNSVLAPLATAVTLPFQAAGVIEDADSNRLVWAEFAPSADAARSEIAVVWGLCKKGATGCSAGTAAYTPTGASIVDSKGAIVQRIGIGVPVLRKQLKFHAPDKDPTILAPLTQGFKLNPALVKTQFGAVQPHTRRLVVLNSYGPQVGLDAAPIAAKAKETGVFDSIEVVNFARAADAIALLPTLTPLDAVVWIGAGVQEKFTDKAEKPLGITVSRGIFGDQLVYGKSITNLLAVPPFGGPGLVVLAGSNTLAAAYFADKSTLGEGLHEPPGRALVGVAGAVTPAAALALTVELLGKLASGAGLATAMAAASPLLVSPMEKPGQEKWRFPGKNSGFWAGKPPSKSALTVQVKMDPPFCTFPTQPCDPTTWAAGFGQNPVAATELTAGHATFSCAGVQWTGPYFSCTGKDANTTADFALHGVMRGRAKGDKLWVYLDGAANAKYRQMLVVGEGTVDSLDEGGGKTTLRFKGIAAAGPYTDQDNNCCTAGSPALTTIKDEPSVLEIWP